MAHEIRMPQLSDTMDSGKILVWNKNIGETVDRGDILAEVETDKANLEIESFKKGILLKIVTEAGSEANVGEVIAYIGEEGEKIEDAPGTPSSDAATKESTPVAEEESPTINTPTQEASSAPESAEKGGNRIKASPLAKKIAQQKGIDLSTLTGTGPGGRIIKKDVEGTQNSSAAPSASTQSSVPAQPMKSEMPVSQSTSSQTSDGNGVYQDLSKMRSTIARRMQESVNQSPHFYVSAAIEMDEVLKLRKLLKTRSGYEKVSINHFVLKAAAYAMEREPRVNYAMKGDKLFKPSGIHIGIITALEEGLLIPVVKDTNTLSLKDLAFEAKAAVERARAGRPTAQDLSGGTFSISNMGMFDVENFTAIINPGQGGILAVSSIKQKPVVRNGEVAVGSVMNVTVSVDHRIIDGIMAGQFLAYFKEALETPALLLL